MVPQHRLGMAARLPLLAFLILSCIGCGNPDLLVISDKYWTSIQMDEATRERIQESSKRNRGRVLFAEIPYPTEPERIAAIISSFNPDAVLLSPLLSRYAPRLTDLTPEKNLFAFGLAFNPSIRADNLVMLETDRSGAYLLAGSMCRRYLDDPANEGRKIAALFYSGGNTRSEERSAFLNGIGEDLEERAIIRSFPRLESTGAVNTTISELKQHDIGLYFVSMSALSEAAVAIISSQSQALIITERALVAGSEQAAFEDRIVASVEEDWIAVFDILFDPQGPVIRVETSLVPGPAYNTLETAWMTGLD